MSQSFIVAIDGPSGSGKSTIAKIVAERLDIRYLDTGAIYRAVAYILDTWNIEPLESLELEHALSKISVEITDSGITVNGEDVSAHIRNPRVSALASTFSAIPQVRAKLLNLQRKQAESCSIVAEGRDMGTVVFPYATVKIFLTAEAEVRAERRWKELQEKGITEDLSEIVEKIKTRDNNDRNRSIAPLKKAEDAILLDTSNISIMEVVSRILDIIKERIPSASVGGDVL
jgi:cytidylate kinase